MNTKKKPKSKYTEDWVPVKNITNGERILPIPNSVFDYIADYISMLRKDKRKYLFVNLKDVWFPLVKTKNDKITELLVINLINFWFRFESKFGKNYVDLGFGNKGGAVNIP